MQEERIEKISIKICRPYLVASNQQVHEAQMHSRMYSTLARMHWALAPVCCLLWHSEREAALACQVLGEMQLA